MIFMHFQEYPSQLWLFSFSLEQKLQLKLIERQKEVNHQMANEWEFVNFGEILQYSSSYYHD